jgi:threonine dehydratase
LLHAFDDPEVIAGQATVAAEILHLDPDVVVVPVGGGGLAAGMASLLRRRGIRIVGAQVAGVDGLRRALRGDAPLPGPPPATLADGLRVTSPGVLPLHIASRSLDDVVLVSEDDVAAAVGDLARAERIVVEGAAAVAAAALARVSGRRRVAVMTGGNIDAPVLAALLARAA